MPGASLHFENIMQHVTLQWSSSQYRRTHKKVFTKTTVLPRWIGVTTINEQLVTCQVMFKRVLPISRSCDDLACSSNNPETFSSNLVYIWGLITVTHGVSYRIEISFNVNYIMWDGVMLFREFDCQTFVCFKFFNLIFDLLFFFTLL